MHKEVTFKLQHQTFPSLSQISSFCQRFGVIANLAKIWLLLRAILKIWCECSTCHSLLRKDLKLSWGQGHLMSNHFRPLNWGKDVFKNSSVEFYLLFLFLSYPNKKSVLDRIKTLNCILWVHLPSIKHTFSLLHTYECSSSTVWWIKIPKYFAQCCMHCLCNMQFCNNKINDRLKAICF